MTRMLRVFLLAGLAFVQTVDARADDAPPDPVSAGSPEGRDLAALGSWMERWLARNEGPVAPRLEALLDHWRLGPKGARWATNDAALPMHAVVEADLDGDGRVETITALSVPYNVDPRRGALYVVRRSGDGTVHVVPSYPDDLARGREWLPTVVIAGAVDMQGDGGAEVVWFSPGSGACIEFIDVGVSTWTGERLEPVGTPLNVVAPRRLELVGNEIVVEHDYEGCAAAGTTMRGGTERHRLDGKELRLSDQRFSPSELAYDRLVDGVNAESFGRVADALDAYEDATEPNRTVLPDASPLDGSPEDLAQLKDLPAAVRAFARFRRGALLMQRGDGAKAAQLGKSATGKYAGLPKTLLGARDRSAACHAAEGWVTAHPDFLTALNAPPGWAEYHWRVDDLCGPLPGGEPMP